MVAAAVLKTVGEIRVGSSPTIDTIFRGGAGRLMHSTHNRRIVGSTPTAPIFIFTNLQIKHIIIKHE